MTEAVNAGAIAGISDIAPEQLAALMGKLEQLEAENKKLRAAAAEQLEDRHSAPGVANESRASAAERFAVVIEEGRDENDMNPIYVGVNGRGYSIRRGEIVEVPAEVLSVLDNAVEVRMIPIVKDGQPAGATTRSARRFPYRNYGKVVDANGNRLQVTLPEGVGA